MSIKVIVGFDGSSPHSYEGVKQESERCFTIFPSWRETKGIDEECPGCGSRLYVRLENSSDSTLIVDITADWETPKRVEHHDYGFTRHESEEEWSQVTGVHAGESGIKYILSLRPGMTEFGLLPAYNYEKLQAYLTTVKAKGFSIETIGQSGQGRNLSLISLLSENPNALNFVIQARDHAYETAGSYCVEGIVDFLHGQSYMADYLKSKFNFYIMPMTNPDGVYKGLSRLTHETGYNVDRFWWNDGPGPEGETILKVLNKLQPPVYMNIHNYAQKFLDALLICESKEFVEKILQHLPADHDHHKRWFILREEEWVKRNNNGIPRPEDCKGGKNYCNEKFNSISSVFELTWFGRNTASMRKRGQKALIALALASVETLKI